MQELSLKQERCKSQVMHKLSLKSKRVVEMVRTTKEKGMKNMEEGMKNKVEATKNKEVEIRTKGKRRKEKVERKILLKERPKDTKSIQGGINPRKTTPSSNKTQHSKKGGVNQGRSSSN